VQFELYQAYVKNASIEQIQKAKASFWNYLNSDKLEKKLLEGLSSEILQELYDTETIRKYLINAEVVPWKDENFPAWETLANRLNNSTSLLDPILFHVRQVIKGKEQEYPSYRQVFTKLFSGIKTIRSNNILAEHIDQINKEIFKLRVVSRHPDIKMFSGISEQEVPVLAEYLAHCFRVSSGSQQCGELIASFIEIFSLGTIEQPLVKMLKVNKTPLNLPSLIPVFYRIDRLTPSTGYLLDNLLLSKPKNNVPIAGEQVRQILQYYLDKAGDQKFKAIVEKIRANKKAQQLIKETQVINPAKP
jgi:hypothetical protein